MRASMMTVNQSNSSANISRELLRDFSQADFSDGDLQTSFDVDHESRSFDPVDCSPIDIVISNQQGEEIKRCSFDQPFVLIGRSPQCDLTLDDKRVSFRHAYIQRLFGRIVCVDLNSRNGIYWGDVQRPFGWFEEQASIRIAGYDFHLISPAQRAVPEEPDFDINSFFRTSSDQSVLPTVSLQYLSKSGKGDSWTINRPITLAGSSPRCKLRLRNQTVSKVHCSLLLKPDGLWVVDLLGKHGTVVNGERVRHSRIADEAILKLGCYTFRVSYGKEPVAQPQKSIFGNGSVNAGVSEDFVSRLIDKFANMQQEFFSHSQRQTEMTFKLFERMHESQSNLLRDEMHRVHEIDRELRELRGMLEGPRNADAEKTAVYNITDCDTSTFDAAAYNKIEQLPSSPVETPSNQVDGDRHASEVDHSDVNVDCEVEESECVHDLDGSAEDFDTVILKENEIPSNQVDEDRHASGVDHSDVNEDCEVEESECLHDPDAGAEDVDNIEIQEDQQLGNTDIDQNLFVLDRMAQLDREKESILKKIMRSVSNSIC